MGIRKVTYDQASCDYPQHDSTNQQLSRGTSYHLIDSAFVVCIDCWDNKMTVEGLLKVIQVVHALKDNA